MTPSSANPDPDAPVYPATSECWACGKVQVVVDRSVGMRSCSNGHETVTWKDDLLPGAIGDIARNVRAAAKSLAAVRARFGPRNDLPPHNID